MNCLLLCCACVVFAVAVTANNNVCRNPRGYDDIQDDQNCWYDPDAETTLEKLIADHGYAVETYKVTTDDGYIITLFRIPGKNNENATGKQPVLLQHGFLAAASLFVINGNKSMAFILSDAGYDVWLGNVRGNQYGRRHIKYAPEDARFWDFSFHEMGVSDLPTNIKFISKLTRRNDIIYLAHSMGNAMVYVYSSMFPTEASQKIKLIVSLAPALFMKDIQVPLNIPGNIRRVIESIAVGAGFNEIGRFNPDLYKSLCLQSSLAFTTCATLFFISFGYNPQQFKSETFPVFLNFFPSGGSLKTLSHYAQLAVNDKFSHYDHGILMNMLYYGSTQAPDYDLSKVTIPSFIMYSRNDALSSVENIKRMNQSLTNVIETYKVSDDYAHLDYLTGKDTEPFHQKLLDVLNRYKT